MTAPHLPRGRASTSSTPRPAGWTRTGTAIRATALPAGASTRPALLNLIDSHDTPRLATMVGNRSDTGYVKPDRFDYDWGAVTSLRQNPSYKVRAPDATGRRLQRLLGLVQMT